MASDHKVTITVLMPVFNSERFLKEAIESILRQTYTHFELLIVNDGSTDDSGKIIQSFKDKRIRCINNIENKGIVAALNEGLNLSRGKYIARMDADDICLPQRLQKQLHFLETNPTYKLCGTKAIAIDAVGTKKYKLNRPTTANKITVFNLFRNAFIHPTIMAEAETFKKIGYNEFYKYAEDYFVFSQFTMAFKVANLTEPLLLYRIHEESITAKKNEGMVESELKTMKFLLSYLIDDPDKKTLLIHHSILRPETSSFSDNETEQHLTKILNANQTKQVFDQKTLQKQLQKEWYNVLLRSKEKNVIKTFLSSPIFKASSLNLKQVFKLMLK